MVVVETFWSDFWNPEVTIYEGTVTRTSLKKTVTRTTQRLAPIILKLHYFTRLAPNRGSHPQRRGPHHIRLFFNVTTRAARTRSDSHHTVARTFFMMNQLKNPRGSHHSVSRTTAVTRTLFFNVRTRAARTRSNSHHAVARTLFSQ